ncbi:MAG: MotA/TolQ/ExbB proton channel family protein [Candidatus Sericytochromatia bacterium]|nr:MotA/TolQ/ExbB proton channel family protein [Candidatus Sericytochromatia bacterium]
MGVILGIPMVLACIYIAMLMSNQRLQDYYDPASLIIVIGGSLGSAAVGSGFGLMFKMPILYLQAILPFPTRQELVVVDMKRMADKARSGGLPALTSEIPTAPNEFVRRGIKLLVAGTDSEVVRTIMEAELSSAETRHGVNTGFLDALAGYFPTFGMLGTVLGIVQAMGNLDDMAALGSALALALLTTLYGVFGANVFILPVSAKLKTKNTTEALVKGMYIDGMLAIQAGSTADTIDKVMKSYVDEKMRAKIEGGKVGKKKTDKHIEYTTYMNPQDQERAMALMAEVKKHTEAKEIGIEDVKLMLAELINEADDKTLCKDFSNEYMKYKPVKKLPKGSKMKGKKRKKGAAGGKKRRLADD